MQYAGEEVVNGIQCKKYTLVEAKGQKINKYNYWIQVQVRLNRVRVL